MTDYPHVPDAPGLTWRTLKHGPECRWRARTDLVRKGYVPKIVRLWSASPEEPEPSEQSILWIQERANALQDDMLTWGRGGLPVMGIYDGTWLGLIRAYQTDPDSSYHKKRYNTRGYYDTLCRRIEKDCGDLLVSETDARTMLRKHEGWADDGKVAMGHAVVGMMRTLATFGATLLKCPACREVKMTLHDMRFPMPRRRSSWLTAEQAIAIRKEAHRKGYHSMALAQALQFDLAVRQKDVIGEWVPLAEMGPPSDVIDANDRWIRGFRGEEIDDNLILRHTTSKKNKDIEVDLNLAPMVLEEIRLLAGLPADAVVNRSHIPAKGPLIVCEATGIPWRPFNFRRKWRSTADAVGTPKSVRNMDSRAGAITEASDAGAPLEHIRQMATHSDIATTAGYSRGQATKTAEVMKARVQHRNKSGTKAS